MDTRITLCSDEKALEILRHESVVKLLSVYPEGIKGFDKYLLGGKVLLVVLPEGDIAEVHIACKFRDRATVKESLIDGMDWLRSMGFRSIWTTAPDHRKGLINMLVKLGFVKHSDRWVKTWA